MLVSEREGLSKIDRTGRSCQLLEGPGPVKAMEGEIFVVRDGQVVVFDMSGKELRRISIGKDVHHVQELVVIPDGRLAFLDNRNDAVYFVDAKGEHIRTVSINEKQDKHWQNMDGVVTKNKLIVSENGENELIAVDLSNYEVSVFRGLQQLRGWLGSITYADERYFICQSRKIYSFTEGSPEITEVAATPEGNITGIAAAEGRLFVAVNGMSRIKKKSLSGKYSTKEGALYEVNPRKGKVKLIRDKLNYPGGVQVIRSEGNSKGECTQTRGTSPSLKLQRAGKSAG